MTTDESQPAKESARTEAGAATNTGGRSEQTMTKEAFVMRDGRRATVTLTPSAFVADDARPLTFRGEGEIDTATSEIRD